MQINVYTVPTVLISPVSVPLWLSGLVILKRKTIVLDPSPEISLKNLNYTFLFVFQEIKSGENTKFLLRLVKRLTRCYICRNTLQSYNRSVPNNLEHSLCYTCGTKFSCQISRMEFNMLAPLLSKVLEFVPRFCRHRGCSTILQRGDDHERMCRLQRRFKKCGFDNCKTYILTRNHSKHLRKFHGLDRYELSLYNGGY